jgi:DNA polymerase III subunit epsilon
MEQQLEQFNWWGSGEKEPTEHLKTKKQLSEIGLRPVKPVGIIHTRKFDCLLYDSTSLESAKPKRAISDKQRQVLAENRAKQQKKRDFEWWFDDYGHIEVTRVANVRWAKKVLSESDWTILDTETTGLGAAEIVEIAIIDLQGNTLLNTLIKPTIAIPQEASNIHGIQDSDVENAPTFPEVYPQIFSALQNRRVLIYNASFDTQVLGYCRKLHNLPSLKLYDRSECLMQRYSEWVGDYHDYYQDYRWQPLRGGHRALSDCLAALNYLKEMAEDSDQIKRPNNIEPSEGWDHWEAKLWKTDNVEKTANS